MAVGYDNDVANHIAGSFVLKEQAFQATSCGGGDDELRLKDFLDFPAGFAAGEISFLKYGASLVKMLSYGHITLGFLNKNCKLYGTILSITANTRHSLNRTKQS